MTPLVAGLLSAAIRITGWAVLCFGLITLLDWFNNDAFSKDKAIIASNAVAVAIYRGIRWAAVLLGSAWILS